MSKMSQKLKHQSAAFLRSVYSDKRLLLLSLFIFSLCVSFIFLLFFKDIGPIQHQIPGTDYQDFYKPLAERIMEKHGVKIQEKATIRYPVGYPAFLAAVFSLARIAHIGQRDIVVIVNVLLGALSTCILFQIARAFFHKPVAVLAALLFATYPFHIWFIKNPHTEVPFITFFFLATLCYLLSIDSKRFLYGFLAGILLGLASLIRAITVYLPFLLAITGVLLGTKQNRKKCVSHSLLFLLGYLVVIGPWVGSVYLNTKKIIPLSDGGPSSIIAGYTLLLIPGEAGDKITLPKDVAHFIQSLDSDSLSTGTLQDVTRVFAKAAIEQPQTIAKLFLIKLTRAWYATSEMWWETTITIVQLIYIIPALVGAIFAWKTKVAKRSILIILFATIGYFWLITTLAASLLRYMVPVMGFVLIFTALTIYTIIQRLFVAKKIESAPL